MRDLRSESDATKKSAVYFDGSCPMCIGIIKTINGSSKSGKFSTHDINAEALPSGLTEEAVQKEMHVIDADGKIYRNAGAILKILEEYPAWKVPVWLGRLPGIRLMLPVGYNFVAANRHFLFGPASRVFWVKALVGLGFIAGVMLSVKLWLSGRFYPLTPVLDNLPVIPYPIDWIVLLVMLCLIMAAIMSSRPRPLLLASVSFVSLLVFFDQSRLQPWVFEYIFMLVALAQFSWNHNDKEGKNRVLNTCRFIIASIYFWSGLQKLNPQFIDGVFPWMVGPIAQFFPESAQVFIHIFGTLVPFIEIGIGIGLLYKRFRAMAIVLAVAMCAFVLLTLGPFGHNWNSVVWPWNIVMVLLVLILFAKSEQVSTREILWSRNNVFHGIVVILFGLMPLLNFFNAWDSYVSWSLYSGTVNESELYVSERVKERLPDYVQSYVHTYIQGRNNLALSEWSFGELNVPPYPERRIFKNVAGSICQYADYPKDVMLYMSGRLSWFNRTGPENFSCLEL